MGAPQNRSAEQLNHVLAFAFVALTLALATPNGIPEGHPQKINNGRIRYLFFFGQGPFWIQPIRRRVSNKDPEWPRECRS
jgi:hypothetical protein